MTISFDSVLGALRIDVDKDLKGKLPVPSGYLKEFVDNHWSAQMTDDDLKIRLVKYLETFYGTSQDNGHALKTEFEEWYLERKSQLNPYYWERLQKYWLEYSVLPVQVVRSVDEVTDEIMGYLGDPENTSHWKRRGLVMGHVQSGKTTNYSALISKAADAGYKIIIVLAGMTNSLRFQTQLRLDESFVGQSSVGDSLLNETYPVARMFMESESGAQIVRHPFCGTTQLSDFNVNTARGIGATEGTFAEPILFVTKKHERVLSQLADWLVGLNNNQSLDGPMLLIDDESDNASVNTSVDPDKPARINQRIRELLACSKRSSYVGYTATPFANIFIDPDTTHEMLEDDLYPKHFIKSLEPPNNYIGADKLFGENGSLYNDCIREVPDDYVDILPLKHKSSLVVEELPESLNDSIRNYVLFRTIRILNGDGSRNSSMLVNVSRFNNVQQQVHDQIYRFLISLKEAINVWALSNHWEQSSVINGLKRSWDKEYRDLSNFTWDEIRSSLNASISLIEVKLVNMKGGGLDYSKAPETGKHVIAVGGLALARGLTLEGLAISYVLRNVGAADTLLQMARWFGYRPGYERLCRVHTTIDMIEDFSAISEAVEELRDDLIRMEKTNRTPDEFGLKVRQSPTGIRITAGNKMRSANSCFLAVDLSNRHLQAFEIYNSSEINRSNLKAVEYFIKLMEENHISFVEQNQAIVWKGVSYQFVRELISGIELPQVEFAKTNDDRSLALDYLDYRAANELSTWDIAIPFKTSRFLEDAKLELPFFDGGARFCRQRFSGVSRDDDLRIAKITEKNIVADAAPKDLIYGEDGKQLLQDYKDLIDSGEFDNEKPPTLERYILSRRNNPLLNIHIFQYRFREQSRASHKLDFNDQDRVTSISLALPSTEKKIVPKEYAATIRFRELMKKRMEESTETDEDLGDE